MKIEIYCDEAHPDLFSSRNPQARYMIIGSLWLRAEDRSAYKNAIHKLRDQYKIGGEFKWGKVSPSRIDFYKALMEWFCELGENLRFRCIAIDHAFYESNLTKDDIFSHRRAQRIDWIKAALEDPKSERYLGWDNKRKRYDRRRRVALVMGNYVVVIGISAKGKGRFITAFVADSGRTVHMIRQNPKWP